MRAPPQGFGYTRADAIIICVGLPLAGFAAYAALTVRGSAHARPAPARVTRRRAQAAGMEAQAASNAVLLVLVGGITLLWTGSYVLRVVNKDMTYVKQLDAYEEAVMQKRLEELPSGELDNLLAEVDAEKARKAARKAAGGGPDPSL